MQELDYHLGKLRLWPGEIVAGTLETTADGHRESWSVSYLSNISHHMYNCVKVLPTAKHFLEGECGESELPH